MSTPEPTGPHRFAGVIPCAGLSRRMGRPKALLDLGGRTFLDHAVRALRGGGCDPVLVVVAGGSEAVVEEAQRAGARVLLNLAPGEGPITSLRLAIAELGATVHGLAYLPVDHPLVRADTVAGLLAAARTDDAPLTLPVHGAKRGHPAIFAASMFPELVDPSLEGGARAVVHRHLARARLLPTDDPGVVTDVDTPDAYASASAAHATAHRRGERT